MSKEEFVPNAYVLSRGNDVSKPQAIDFALNMHDWSEDEQECPLKSNDGKETVHKHFMRCRTCGKRRFGGYAEPMNYHYFLYEQPGGHRSEYIPPCATPPDPSIGVVDDFLDLFGKRVLFCRALKFIDGVKSRA